MGQDRCTPTTDEASPSATTASFVALLLLTVPLAGCMDGGSDQETQPPTEGDLFSAREGLEQANQTAESWSADAELAGISMIEQGGEPENWPAAAFNYTSDPSVGDGEVPQWLYFYTDGETVMAVYLNAEGETHQDEDPPNQTPEQPITNWSVDSTEAVDAAQEDENFSAIADEDDAEILYALQEGQQGPFWIMRARSDAMDQNRTMVVDAQTGEAQSFG
jgi:hypothetical protein